MYKNYYQHTEMTEEKHIELQNILYDFVCDKVDKFETTDKLNRAGAHIDLDKDWIGNKAKVLFNGLTYEIEV